MERQKLDMDAYIERINTGPCFICQIISGETRSENQIVYEDEIAIAFMNKYPTLEGYVLVCPREHREQVTRDFSQDEYLALQKVVYRVAAAVQQVVPTERLYLCSLGSQQGNRHVHWHVAPLPAGVPFADQQCAALSLEKGYLSLSDAEKADLAQRIRAAMPA